MKIVSRIAAFAAAVSGLLLMSAGPASAQTASCSTSPAEWTLWAGQTINSGTVTVTNDSTMLHVTYKLDTVTYPAATFGTLHLWVGNDMTNLPKAGNGAPIPGQFPFIHDATGQSEYTFDIPLSDIGIVDITTACPLTLYVVPHAEVNWNGSNGDRVEDTAFGGNQNGTGPRWWYYGAYCLTCDFGQLDFVCKTAFAKGGYVFVTDRKSNPENLPSLNLSKNRWGWAINVTSTGETTYDIYAGAGLNKTSNGVKVGTLTVNWDGSYATVSYNLVSPNVMEELHIYAGDVKPVTTAPGQYGTTVYFDPKAPSYTTTLPAADTTGDGIWIIAHAVSCYPVN